MRERSKASCRKRQAATGRTVRESVRLPAGFARCPDCGDVKDLKSFPRSKRAPTGGGGYCRPCHNARGVATYTRLYESTRDHHLRRSYGITAADDDALVEDQGGGLRALPDARAASRRPRPRHGRGPWCAVLLLQPGARRLP